MSIGPMGMIASAAGSPLSQASGSETSRAARDTANQARQSETDRRAEAASGIGETSEDSETQDRDADGRRLWEASRETPPKDDESSAPLANEPPQSKDPTGETGRWVDLTG